eukprot:CAMPEP_0204562378 /NCGR_PEP_ID=MMETSP0661-20131031/33718_1 /ASSEMBLY_ACC=CAM_ASM_000606 /TAXON_ID=109239 /ORGANISM="Alexandrium margalefi, Strain AMGDE01CS-322" /LENGTH=34 /DNA_ID= /DNA_START= /DNA_END= /DNA_ORIENTATION=
MTRLRLESSVALLSLSVRGGRWRCTATCMLCGSA